MPKIILIRAIAMTTFFVTIGNGSELTIACNAMMDESRCLLKITEKVAERECCRKNDPCRTEYLHLGGGVIRYAFWLGRKAVTAHCNAMDGYFLITTLDGNKEFCENCIGCKDKKTPFLVANTWKDILALYTDLDCAFDLTKRRNRQLGTQDSLFASGFSSVFTKKQADKVPTAQDSIYIKAIETAIKSKQETSESECLTRRSLDFLNSKADSMMTADDF